MSYVTGDQIKSFYQYAAPDANMGLAAAATGQYPSNFAYQHTRWQTGGRLGQTRQFPPKPKPIRQSYSCEMCSAICNSEDMYQVHISGKKHLKKLKESETGTATGVLNFGCELCGVFCSSQDVLQMHLTGIKHRKKLAASSGVQQASPVACPNDPSSPFHCALCNVTCMGQDGLDMHNTGVKHKKNMGKTQFEELKSAKDPSVYCEVCDLFMDPNCMVLHQTGTKHKRKLNQPGDECGPAKRAKERSVRGDEEGTAVTPLIGLMTIERCAICDEPFPASSNAIIHYQSRKHARQVEEKLAETNPFYCKTCHVSCNDQSLYDMHLKGFKHQWRESNGTLDPSGPFAEKIKQMRVKRRAFTPRVASTEAAVSGEEAASAVSE